MKKYVKPELFFESYELSQNIAACAWDMNHAEGSCMAEPDPDFLGTGWGGNLFTKKQGCYYKSDDGYEQYCYHTGADIFKVFQS